MDLSNYRSNPFYDSLINRIVNNELKYDEAIRGLFNNEFINQSNLNTQSNEYFVNYFVNSLHLSCYWIINNAANQVKSIQNTPLKLVPIQIPIKKTPNEKLADVKKNLFDTKNEISSKFDNRFETKFENRTDNKFDHRLEARFESNRLQKQNEQKIDRLNLTDEESFPKLNSSSFIKTTPNSTSSSAERKSVTTPNQATDQTKSSKKQRRINPTLIQDCSFENKKNLRKTLFEKNRKIFDEAPELEQQNSTTRDEIKKMTKDISIITPKKKDLQTASPSSTNFQLMIRTPTKINQESIIQPNLDKVTVDKIKFENLILFYTNLIKHNLIPNVLAELDFLIQLLIKRSTCEQSTEFLNSFEFCSNYHNCVYFAVNSLDYLYDELLIDFFDEQFFKTLSSNESIKKLSPHSLLNKLLNFKQSDHQNDQMLDLSIVQQPSCDFIAYQPETDSNENFLNDNSFHLFRRQRDAFFKLYYEWKQLYTKKCFKQDSILNDQEFKFINKVTFIFSLSKDFANYFHLARLFLAQLMQCCIGASNIEQQTIGLIKSKAAFNESTPNVCENKMKKLNKRFNQQDQKVMATQSSFTGEEIFFYDFIVACNNYSFLTILQSLLISKITELNYPNLLIDQIEFDETNLEIASNFCANLLNLQLLAKFLGLIVFMPFYSKSISNASNRFSNNLNEIVKNLHSEENKLSNKINQMIINSLKGQYLISTLPWVIQFLNQMDSNTVTLTNYDQTFNLLIDVYHELGFKNHQYQIDKMNYAYLKLIFGNFFEKYFFICHIKFFEITDTQLLSCSIQDQDKKTLDSFQLINKKFLNACFPKLFMIKEMIKQGSTQATEIRKIKPLSLNNCTNENLTATPPQKKNAKNLVQIEFEENFFRLHPDSLRKTVEFVTDRQHSKCIKTLRHDIIKKIKRETFAKHSDLSKTETIKEEIKNECVQFVKQFAHSKICETLDLLISEHDFSLNTIEIAKSIATRMLLDKCFNWISNNVNDSWIINETLVEKSRRANETKLTMVNSISNGNQHVPKISYCFNRVRDVICDLLFKNQLICSIDELYSLIDELTNLRNPNSNLNQRTNQVIETTMIDLIITLVAFQAKLVDSKLIQKFISFYLDYKLTVTRFISPRNFYILSLSKESLKTWDKFESILIRFVQKEIYSIPSLECDILCVLGNQNDSWDDEVLRKFASCIKSVVETCKSDKKFREHAEKIELIDWTSWFCGQTNDEF